MTQAEAERECARLASEHPERATHRWLPQPAADGQWRVVKISLPPDDPSRTAEVLAAEKPPTADDPRSTSMQNIGPNAGPGI